MIGQKFNSTYKSFPVSLKIRLEPKKDASGEADIASSIETARKIESAGASWITICAISATQRSEIREPDRNAFKQVFQSLKVLVVANGLIFSLSDVEKVH